MCRLAESHNSIIKTLVNPALSAVRFTSGLWNHWCFSLYVNIWTLFCMYCRIL